ncbi:PepSY domain-containing protein [Cellulophaga baltica]|uniref:PepSY-associated TM helix domain-containing protein n=1 Tax=Cellulophaga TaxID=104264 RepID=UPI001C064DD4|nr:MULTISPECIES: PepSY-associated TM helix domain-containing protein [Cellulophaga]MBU2995296.1 PepSY domain-containing protein [Cellulophaga baltica]MDO6766691.1 PepSY-associated TM helix domain-containing protein [Cellulophaga sp. 1_MG-2023]
MRNYTIRKFINDIHLWLGIASGIVLFIVCLTGTILAFETELVQTFDKQDHFSEKTGNKVPFEIIVKNLEADGSVVKDFIFFNDESQNIQFTLLTKEEANSGKPARGKSVQINPYTGKKVISIGKTRAFIHFIEEFHRYLLLDTKIGRPIVGVCTIIFIILCISGLILWMPKKLKQFKKWKSWKQGLTLKTKANWKRINYDIHNTFGFYALFPMLLMGLTGLLWSFQWYYNGLEVVLGDKLGKSRFDTTILLNTTEENSPKLNLSTLLQKADSILPYENKATRINLPLKKNESVMIRKKSNAFLAYDATDKLQFNPYTNKLVSKTLFKNEKFGSKIAILIRSIHVGSFAGNFTKIIYFLACLIATSLPVTGTIIWINKLKKK